MYYENAIQSLLTLFRRLGIQPPLSDLNYITTEKRALSLTISTLLNLSTLFILKFKDQGSNLKRIKNCVI